MTMDVTCFVVPGHLTADQATAIRRELLDGPILDPADMFARLVKIVGSPVLSSVDVETVAFMPKQHGKGWLVRRTDMDVQVAARDAEITWLREYYSDLYNVPFRVVQAVAELPDRTSPDGDPEMMQVTTKELTGIVRSAIDAHDGYCAAHDTARLDWLESRRFPELRKFDDGFLVATDQVCRSSGHPTARAAIDAAMNAENGNG
ncbi:hypothetical protein K6L44_12395 [Gluconacetobacter entanii]|uniref:hypothetical protein n=1 Tax=Gluconacetobacter entanii TaxID=108528 RepID=UPI001C9327F5|nr:hypothetical protein [Gluconacetobacter entanii]MBY4640768.1 hypothetical protein [Gluconacetobacter entanii]MCW4581205.1 hypothetical protein [Gluconacetobacter entanii]MCW4584465.1 hypothetical protein [Gluconacetobacter entanii]MCW4587871.1 hypothetical protein [Gluconacetobacter entanii]